MSGHHNVVPQGVSGASAPEQGALRLAASADKTGEQSCDEKKKRARQLRFYLSDHHYDYWKDAAPKKRHDAFAAVLGAAESNIDLGKLIEAAAELRRLGILLNQVVRLAHQDKVPLDFSERVLAVVEAVEALKP